MKRISGKMIALIVVVGVAAVLLIGGVSTYNGLVGVREDVSTQSANIDTNLQRRADLIPNLVNSVKGYVQHEEDVFTAVSDARARLAGAGTMEEKAAANGELSSALSRLLAITESYPDLKADTQFTALNDELSRTENRIAVARRDYNEAVRTYNSKIQTFPAVLFARLMGFSPAEYFEADPGSSSVPSVDFS